MRSFNDVQVSEARAFAFRPQWNRSTVRRTLLIDTRQGQQGKENPVQRSSRFPACGQYDWARRTGNGPVVRHPAGCIRLRGRHFFSGPLCDLWLKRGLMPGLSKPADLADEALHTTLRAAAPDLQPENQCSVDSIRRSSGWCRSRRNSLRVAAGALDWDERRADVGLHRVRGGQTVRSCGGDLWHQTRLIGWS